MLTDEIRKNSKITDTLEEAIDAAIDNMADDSILKPFLISNKAEVKLMCITEYNEEKFANEQKAEGMTEGMAKGLEKGRAEGVLIALQKMIESGISEAEITEQKHQLELEKAVIDEQKKYIDEIEKLRQEIYELKTKKADPEPTEDEPEQLTF